MTADEVLGDILRERQTFLKGYLQTASIEEMTHMRPDLEDVLNKRSLQKVRARQAARLNGRDEDVPDEDRVRMRRRKEPDEDYFGSFDDLMEDVQKEG